MIYLKLELWPGGDKSRAQDLGSAVIANESDLSPISSYSISLLKGKRYSPNNAGQVWKTGELHGWPRGSQSIGPWELLYLLLENALGNRASLARRLCKANEKYNQKMYGIGYTTDFESFGMTGGPTPDLNKMLEVVPDSQPSRTACIVEFYQDEAKVLYAWYDNDAQWISFS